MLDELPSPYLLLGDFNCKNSRWGSPRVVANEPIAFRRGTDLLNIIEPWQIHILNTGKPTRIQLRNLTYSHIDLSIGSPEICTNFNWDTEPDPHGSDHLPIIVSHSLNNMYTHKPIRWDTERTPQTSWKNYQESINLPQVTNYANATEACQGITDHILDVADQHVNKTSANINTKYFNPWWNEDCAIATKEKRRRRRILKRCYSTENLIAFKRAEAKAKFIIKNAKRNSWCLFVSTLNRYTTPKTMWKKSRK